MSTAIPGSPTSADLLAKSELDRLDLQHHVITLLLGGELHLAPLLNPKKILDIGTGTGLWAIEMADRYPDAMVVGTDLSPTQPTWYDEQLLMAIVLIVLIVRMLGADYHLGYLAMSVLRLMTWKADGPTKRTHSTTFI